MAYHRTVRVEQQLANNRVRILQAARRLVSEGGWAEAQVASIAAAAGLATGTVYRYFPSKADLFSEVLAKVSQREVDVIADIADSGAAPRERLHDAVFAFAMRAMRNRSLAYALIAEPCAREIDAARLVWRQAIGRQIVRIVRAGQADRSFRAEIDADLAAALIVGGFMEALVGPLSPLALNPDTASDDAGAVAEAIASACCACVVRVPAESVPVAQIHSRRPR